MHRMRGPVVTALVAALLVVGVAVSAQDTTPRIAVLARSDNPVDALAASAIAAQFGGAVYLTPSTTLSDDARDGLVEFDPELVIIAGGPVALSADVESAVRAIPFPTRRVAGENREATARELNKLLAEFDAVFPLAADVAATTAALDAAIDALTERVEDLEDAPPGSGGTPASTGPRLQAHVVPGAPPELERAIGVTAVTSPINGVHCLDVASTADVDLSEDVVHVGIDWSNSVGDNLRAYWDATDALDACPDGHIVVQTFGATADEDNEVAFTVLVP